MRYVVNRRRLEMRQNFRYFRLMVEQEHDYSGCVSVSLPSSPYKIRREQRLWCNERTVDKDSTV